MYHHIKRFVQSAGVRRVVRKNQYAEENVACCSAGGLQANSQPGPLGGDVQPPELPDTAVNVRSRRVR